MLFRHINRPYLSNAYQAAALSVYDCAAICYEICIYEKEKAFCWFAGRDINGKQWSDHKEVWRLRTGLYWHYWNEDRFLFKLFFAKKKIQNQTKNKQAGNIHLHWFYKGTRLWNGTVWGCCLNVSNKLKVLLLIGKNKSFKTIRECLKCTLSQCLYPCYLFKHV